MVNNNTISSLTRTEAQLVAPLSYEQKDIVTTQDVDDYLPRGFKITQTMRHRKCSWVRGKRLDPTDGLE